MKISRATESILLDILLSKAETPLFLPAPGLRQWLLDERIVSGRHEPPSLDGCSILSALFLFKVIEFGLVREHIALLSPYDAETTEMQKGLNQVQRAIERLNQLNIKVDKLHRAYAKLVETSECLLPKRPFWFDFAWPLGHAFRTAMRSTNPTAVFAVSNDGPLVRFVEKTVYHITGERPARQTIARYMQRNPEVIKCIDGSPAEEKLEEVIASIRIIQDILRRHEERCTR